MKGTITIDKERCKGCSLCIEYCPKGVISLSDKLNVKGYFVVDSQEDERCTGCATCAIMCPEVAIEVYRGVQK
jgi:2-oxoglutarate ferredoxin oxidoreductase subunit delta